MKKETIRVKETDIMSFLGTEDVPEELQDYVGQYEISEWTFGERERIIGNSSKQVVGEDGKIISTMDSSVFRLEVMRTCIKKCPLKTAPTNKYISGMPTWLGEAIWEKVSSLNDRTMDSEEAKKFILS
jgi:hypothetical protein